MRVRSDSHPAPRPVPAPAAPYLDPRFDHDVLLAAARDRRIALRCALAGICLACALAAVSGIPPLIIASPPVLVGLGALGLCCWAAPVAGDLARRDGVVGRVAVGALYGLACVLVPAAAGGLSAMLLDAGRALSWGLGHALLDYVGKPVLWVGLFGGLPGVGLGVVFAASARR